MTTRQEIAGWLTLCFMWLVLGGFLGYRQGNKIGHEEGVKSEIARHERVRLKMEEARVCDWLKIAPEHYGCQK